MDYSVIGELVADVCKQALPIGIIFALSELVNCSATGNL